MQAYPIGAPARAQDLTLRHRVDGYRAGDLDRSYSTLPVEEDVFINYGFVTRQLQRLMHPRTVASLRLRGYTKPCYNVLEFESDEVKITRTYPFGGGSVIAHFQLSTGEQYHRELEPPVQQRRLPAAHQGES